MHTNKVARPASVGSAVAAFALTGLAALLAIWMAVVWVARKDATRAAVEEAKECTVAKGAALVPALSDGILTGDRGALNTLDALVRGRVLSATTVRVTIGRIEVRTAAQPAQEPVRPRRERTDPVLTLDEYLRQRREGQR